MIQPFSYVHPDAKIAANVVIDPFVTVGKNVEIGQGTWIGSNVTIMEGARIGENCKIFPGAVISAVPQDLKFEGEESLAIIGNNTTVRECVTINRGTKALGRTEIGNNCLLMTGVHIAHDCIVGDNVILVNNVALGGHITIGDYAILSANTLVHQFVTIGAHAMVTGGSLVRKDIPPYVKVAHEPISYAGVNSIGLRRRKFSSDKIHEIQKIYRILFQKGYNVTTATDIIEAEIEATDERDEILTFIRNSKRGIMKGYSKVRNEE